MRGIKIWTPVVVIISLVVFYVINNHFWQKNDGIPAYNDQAHHLTNYLSIVRNLENSSINENGMYYDVDSQYAPLYYASAAAWTRLSGESRSAAVFINIFFYLILLISVYGIGRKAFGPGQGLAACLLLSFYPYVFGASRVFIIEFSLCALAALSVCLLFYSQGLLNSRLTIAAAVACLLGMLTKQSFIIYVIGPLLLTLKDAFRQRIKPRRILVFLGIGLILPALFYCFFLFRGTWQLFQMHFIDASLFSPIDYWQRNLYYFLLLPDQMNWLNLFVFIISFALYVRLKHKDKLFLLTWLLVPYAILFFAPLKNSRYSLPVLPAIALISAWGIFMVKSPLRRNILLGLVLAFGLAMHYALFFDIDLYGKIALKWKLPNYGLWPYAEYVHRPLHKNLYESQRQLFRILKDNAFAGQANTIGITDYDYRSSKSSACAWCPFEKNQVSDNFTLVNEWGMQYFIIQNRLPYSVYMLSSNEKVAASGKEMPFDLLVTVCPLSDIFPALAGDYKLCGQISLPSDNSGIYCYVRTVPVRPSDNFYSQWTKERCDNDLISAAQENFRKKKYKTSIKLLNQSLEDKHLSERLKGIAYIGLANNYVGKMERDLGITRQLFFPLERFFYPGKAKSYFKKASEYIEATNALTPSFYSGLGYLYLKENKADLALQYLTLGLASYPRDNSQKEYVDICTNIGYCYLQTKNFGKAKDYFLNKQ